MLEKLLPWFVVICWTGVALIQLIKLQDTFMIVLAIITIVVTLGNIAMVIKNNWRKI